MALTRLDLSTICPTPLKTIKKYLAVAWTCCEQQDVVSYWCYQYALQTGLKLSTKTLEETNFLLKVMDYLEETKKKLHDNEAITNNVAAQAHLKKWARSFLLYGNKEVRAANFSKPVVLSFYFAHTLYDVLTLFGELSVEATQNQKYALWKARDISKYGETPVPDPMKKTNDENDSIKASNDIDEKPESSKDNTSLSIPSIPANPPTIKTQSFESKNDTYETESGTKLSVMQIAKAKKLIKRASSALDHDDLATSVTKLRKVLHLLTTGSENPCLRELTKE